MNAATAAFNGRVLLLIDFQHDFLDTHGKMPVNPAHVQPVLGAAARAIAEARQGGDLIVAVGNEFRPGDRLMNLFRRHASIAGSPGAAWTAALPLKGIRYFPKWAASAFVNTELDTYLEANGVKTLVITGLFANACVTATCKDGLSRNYAVEIVADAIACASDTSRQRALAKLAKRGARIVTTT
jgi:nicotinamidase-related amidase